VNSLSKVEK